MYLKVMDFINKWILPILIALILGFGLHMVFIPIVLLIWIGYLIYTNRERFFSLFGQMAHINANLEKSIELYAKAYEKDPDNIKNALTYGYLILKSGDPDRAAELIEPYSDGDFHDDDTLLARINLSLIRWKQGHLDEAISILEVLHMQNFKNTITYGNLGLFYILDGQDNDAYKICKEAYQFNNDDCSIIENYARINHIVRKMDIAGELYEKLLKKNPIYPDSWYNAGLYYLDAGKTANAEKAFKKALSLDFNYLTICTKEQIEKATERLALRNSARS